MSRFEKFIDEKCMGASTSKADNKKKKKKMDEGVGYELYAKGADRIAAQCKQVIIYAEKLAEAARQNKSLPIKKKALKELTKWIGSIQGELKGLTSDVNNLEGYK